MRDDAKIDDEGRERLDALGDAIAEEFAERLTEAMEMAEDDDTMSATALCMRIPYDEFVFDIVGYPEGDPVSMVYGAVHLPLASIDLDMPPDMTHAMARSFVGNVLDMALAHGAIQALERSMNAPPPPPNVINN
mgnify:CR=1 FL=1